MMDVETLKTMPKHAKTFRYIVYAADGMTFTTTAMYHNTGRGTDWEHGFNRAECDACPVCPNWPKQGRRRVQR